MQVEFEKALAFHQRGQLGQAEQGYRGILQAQPRHFGAAHLLGVVFMQRGQPELAEQQIRHALEINSDVAEAHGNLGNALNALARHDEALASYERALALKPGFAEAWISRGWVLQELARFDEALASYDRAIALGAPNYLAFYNRAILLQALKRHEEALASMDQALAIRPDAYLAIYNRGLILHDLQRLDEALAAYERAAAIKPDNPHAHYSRGNALRDLKRLDEALAAYDRALQLKPDFPEALKNRGIVRLLVGDFAGGWADYEHRQRSSAVAPVRAALDLPVWSGEPLDGRNILVTDASGLGDTLQFCRYLPLLVAKGARVAFLGQPKIYRALSALAPGVRFLSEADDKRGYDYQVRLMSLPFVFKTDLDSIPRDVPYLRAEPERVAHWAERIGSSGLRVGVCWQGNPHRFIDAGRSLPVAAMRPVAQVPGVRLISLQKHFGLEQLERLPEGMAVETLGDDFDSGPDAFVDSAAVIANLDLVISSDTSIAHLAGALGKPTWVAIRHVPEWRWMLDRSDSPWYPHMRLFRQPKRDDWASVFEGMASALMTSLPLGSG